MYKRQGQPAARQAEEKEDAGTKPAAAEALTAPSSALVKPSASIEAILLDERSTKAAKLQLLLENLISRTVQESNETILKELDFQFRQMEEMCIRDRAGTDND